MKGNTDKRKLIKMKLDELVKPIENVNDAVDFAFELRLEAKRRATHQRQQNYQFFPHDTSFVLRPLSFVLFHHFPSASSRPLPADGREKSVGRPFS